MSNIRKLNNNANIVGNNIKKIRKEKNITQSKLCIKLELLGITLYSSDIYEIENNKRLVKDFEIKAICLALDISIDKLYQNTDRFFEY